MNPKIEQAYGTLELLIDKLSFYLPGHEDGGYIYPFVWEEKALGEFNIFNLCEENNWLELTDIGNIITSWQHLEYARCFNDFSFSPEQIKAWEDNINVLEQIIRSLHNLEAYIFKNSSYGINSHIVFGQIDDSTWVGIAPTIYVETTIPQEIIARHTKYPKNLVDFYGGKAVEFDAKIKAIIAQLGAIELDGDFGGGYIYSYTHKIVYGFGETKELAFKNTIQKTGMLEVSEFAGLYSNKPYIEDRYHDRNTQEIYQKYDRINKFMNQTFEDS